jgi:hypothetical protein
VLNNNHSLTTFYSFRKKLCQQIKTKNILTWKIQKINSLTLYFSTQIVSKILRKITDFSFDDQKKDIWSLFHVNNLRGACNRSPGSKLFSITTQLHCGGHLGGRARLSDTILEEDHPMTIPPKFGSNWATGSRQRCFLCEFPIGSYAKLSSAVQPSWSEGGTTRHNFGRGPSNDYFIKI